MNEVLSKLRYAPSNKAKQDILKRLGPLERQAFRYTYGKDYTYGVTFNLDEEPLTSMGMPTLEMFTLLNRLRTRQLTGSAAKSAVQSFALEHGNLIKAICNKDLDCGIAATTVNKAWPGLIPQFKVQLAKEVPIEKLTYPLYAQTKYDGVRIIITKRDGQVMFRTRNGKVIHLPETAATLAELLPADIMLDSEVTLASGTCVERTRVSGMINSARSGNRIDEHLLVFHVFDCMSLFDFECSKCTVPYLDRLHKAHEIIDRGNKHSPLKAAHTWVAATPARVNQIYADLIDQGLEGLILKSPKHLYTFKRSADWVKLKEIKTADLQCVDYVQGTGKYQGMIGALACEGLVEGQHVTVNVGSGLTDEDRQHHPSDFIARTIEVKYNSIIQDSITKEWSLFLPRFVMVRFDK